MKIKKFKNLWTMGVVIIIAILLVLNIAKWIFPQFVIEVAQTPQIVKFGQEAILQRAKNIGIQFDKFSEMEFYVNVVKNYTDHKKSIGENPDMAIKLAKDDFFDEDGQYKGSEWLAVYYDTFVEDDN